MLYLEISSRVKVLRNKGDKSSCMGIPLGMIIFKRGKGRGDITKK